MKTNEGNLDRFFRVVVGVAAASAGFFAADFGLPLRVAAVAVGLIAVVTGVVGVCPIYALLGVNTCGVRR